MSQPGNGFFEKLVEKVVAKLKLTTPGIEEIVKKVTEWGPLEKLAIEGPQFKEEGGAGEGEGEEAGQLSVRFIPSLNGEAGMLQIRGRVNVSEASTLETVIATIPAADSKGNNLRPSKFQRFLVAVDALPMAGFTFLTAEIVPSGQIKVKTEQRGEFAKSTAIYFNHIIPLD